MEVKGMLKTRLRKCAELAGNGASLARETGIPRRTLETYLSGTAEPKASRLADIAKVAGVSGHWLLLGEGVSRPSESDRVSEFELASEPVISELTPQKPPQKCESAGSCLAVHHSWLLKQGWKADHLRLLEARGDSMSPTIHDGSLILVNIVKNELDGDGVYVIEVDGVLLLRRIQFDIRGGVLAGNDNPAYREQYLQMEHRQALNVFGQVVWAGNRLA